MYNLHDVWMQHNKTLSTLCEVKYAVLRDATQSEEVPQC